MTKCSFGHRQAFVLMRSAKHLKRMTLAASDPRYEHKLIFIMPFLRLFSPSMGLSSKNLWTALTYRDASYVRRGFHAMDFDDWCRCLHKMSLFPIPVLADCLRTLQKTDIIYACLIHNLAQSVYLCLLYWAVSPHILQEFARRASLHNSKYVDVLTIDNLCTPKDWTTVPSTPILWQRHASSCAHVFSSTYKALLKFEFEPIAYQCCSVASLVAFLRGIAFNKRDQHTIANGKCVDDDIEGVFKDLRALHFATNDLASSEGGE